MSYNAPFTCLKFIPLLVFLLILQSASAQDFKALDDLTAQYQKEYNNNVVVMVWKDSILYQKSTHQDVTINTQAPIGCTSAWLTAALVMTFVEQGKLKLDDPVSKYLPIFAKYAKKYLTIRHCLNNTTGLAGEKGGVERFFQKNKFTTLEDQVNAFASGREIVDNPGGTFAYSDIGSNIAGRVLEVVGKRSFDRLMLERIFRPLGMKKSSFMSDRAVNPFSGCVSTPSDMLKFTMMLLNGGSLGTKKVLDEVSVAELHKMQTGDAKMMFVPEMVAEFSYGFGSWIHDAAGNGPVYGAPGLTGGWTFINTEKKYACVIFCKPKDKVDKKSFYLEVAQELQNSL